MYQTYHTTLHRIVNSNRTQRTFPNKWPSSALKSEIRALSEPMICPNEPRIYFWHVLMFWSDTQIPLHVKVPYCRGGDLDSWSNAFPPRFCQRAMSKAQLIQAGLLEKPKMSHLTSHPYRAMPSTPLHLKMAQALKVTMSKENLVWKHIVAISLHLWNLVNPKAKLKSLVIPGGDVELFYQPKTSLEKKNMDHNKKNVFTRQPASQDWLFEKKQLSIHRRRIKVSENMRRCQKKTAQKNPKGSNLSRLGMLSTFQGTFRRSWARYVPQRDRLG